MRLVLPSMLVAASCALATPAAAEVITFDDLTTASYAALPGSYKGYTWVNWASINGPNYGASGYANGVVSGGNVACGCASDFGLSVQSIARAGLFTLGSGYFTSAWNDGATLLVEGRLGATTLFNNSTVLNTSGPTLINFNWSGIDNVRFSISGGTPSGLPGGGDYFGVDNLQLTAAVPEPTTWAMMILGFGLIGGALRSRRRVRVNFLRAA